MKLIEINKKKPICHFVQNARTDSYCSDEDSIELLSSDYDDEGELMVE